MAPRTSAFDLSPEKLEEPHAQNGTGASVKAPGKRRCCGESFNRARLLLGMKPVCDATNEDGTVIDDGAAMYSPDVLQTYDAWVLNFVMPRVWGCPKELLLNMYNKHAGNKHIDVGPGTGYFLKHSTFPRATQGKENVKVALLDLSPHCLDFCATELAGEFREVRTYQRDVLADTPVNLPDEPFDSIGMSLLFHCVPGANLKEKVSKAIACLCPALSRGGVFFGATVLGSEEDGAIKIGLRKWWWLKGLNSKNIFQNTGDTCEGLCEALDANFAKWNVRVVGNVALFAAYKD